MNVGLWFALFLIQSGCVKSLNDKDETEEPYTYSLTPTVTQNGSTLLLQDQTAASENSRSTEDDQWDKEFSTIQDEARESKDNNVKNSLIPKGDTESTSLTEAGGNDDLKETSWDFFATSTAEFMDFTGSTTSTTTTDCSNIPQINFTRITPYIFSLDLEWEELYPDCNLIFHIYLNDEPYVSVSNLSITVDNLYACTVYTVSIAAASETANGSRSEPSTIKTIAPSPFPYTVQSFEASPDNSSLVLTWQPPEDQVVECVTVYKIGWWPTDSTTTNEIVVQAPANSTIIDIVGCMSYEIQNKPMVSDSIEGNGLIINVTAPAIPTTAPDRIDIYTGRTTTNITWETESSKTNKCELQKISVTCNAPRDNNQDASWIIWNATADLEISTPSVDWRYTTILENLSPFTNYSCEGLVTNSGGNSSVTSIEFRTEDDVPTAPGLNITYVEAREFTIEWQAPDKIPGVITSFELHIENNNPQQRSECLSNFTNTSVSVASDARTYKFDSAEPYNNYSVVLYGVDGAGDGEKAQASTRTLAAEPESVINALTEEPTYQWTEEYNSSVKVTYQAPCKFNGPFKYYSISFTGKRDGFSDDSNRSQLDTTEMLIGLLPERNYSIEITVVNDYFNSTTVTLPYVLSRAGVPKLVKNITSPTLNSTLSADFTLEADAYSNINGEIIAYALFLLRSSVPVQQDFGFWDGMSESWPTKENATQLTPNLWNPFQGGATAVKFLIDDRLCGKGCLEENTEYGLVVRALTRAAYKDSPLLKFKTGMLEELNLALILGLTFGLLFLLLLLVFWIILWRRKQKNGLLEEEKRISTTPSPIPVQKFNSYYPDIKENYTVIKQQFDDLGIKSKEYTEEITFATLPENRRKNRWTNILPFDFSRVSLQIDEDDEISSDYINASYVRGYSGKIEYIATQGPLETTTKDFWRMVLQEHVSVIVMVTQFVEQGKEKCYQYFPNNHESATYGESIEVKCSTELHFGTYCIRTLQVRKGVEQRDVIHMQFLEWPDFGVPQGTDNMLQFCHQIREKVNKEGGLIVIHCSAGVGRTGTLIALDILLQTIDDHRNINIYKTVLDLRKQRTNMVQTEKQYLFIHTCIKEYIEYPTTPSTDAMDEKIYENMEVIKQSLEKPDVEKEIESAL